MTNPILHTDPTDYSLIESFSTGINMNNRVPTYSSVSSTEVWECSQAGVNEPYLVNAAGYMTVGSASTANMMCSIEAAASTKHYYFEFLLASNDILKFAFRKQVASLDDNDGSSNSLFLYIKNNSSTNLQTRIISKVAGFTAGDPFAEHDASVDEALKQGVLIHDKGTSIDVTINGITVNHLVSTTAFTDDQQANFTHIGFNLLSTGTVQASNVRTW